MTSHPEWCGGHQGGTDSCIGKAGITEATGGRIEVAPWLFRFPELQLEEPQVIVTTTANPAYVALTSPGDAVKFAGVAEAMNPEVAAHVRSAAALAWPSKEPGLPEPEA